MKDFFHNKKIFSFNRWWILAISLFLILAGFFIPFGIIYSKQKENISYPSKAKYALLDKQKNWKISNSYLVEPFSGKGTVENNIKDILDLDSRLDVNIYEYTEDLPKDFADLKKIDVDIYKPQIILKFDYAILDGTQIVHVGKIDNTYMLTKLFVGLKAGYFDLFSVDKGSSVNSALKQINQNIVAQNNSVIKSNLIKNKLGDEDDLPYISSAIDFSDSIKIDTTSKTFKITSKNTTSLLNNMVNFSTYLNIKKFDEGTAYPYFEITSIGAKYLQNLLGLKAQNDKSYNLPGNFSADDTVKDVRAAINSTVTELALKKAGMYDSLGKITDLFAINLIKTPSNMSNTYSDNVKVGDMWGASKNEPYTYVELAGINDKYDEIKGLFQFDKGYDETIWFNIVEKTGGDK